MTSTSLLWGSHLCKRVGQGPLLEHRHEPEDERGEERAEKDDSEEIGNDFGGFSQAGKAGTSSNSALRSTEIAISWNNRNVHVWKSTTEEGEKREVRAEKFGGNWRFQAKLRGEENWTYYEAPPLADLLELHDVLWRKYQSASGLLSEDVAAVEKMDFSRERGEEVRRSPLDGTWPRNACAPKCLSFPRPARASSTALFFYAKALCS